MLLKIKAEMHIHSGMTYFLKYSFLSIVCLVYLSVGFFSWQIRGFVHHGLPFDWAINSCWTENCCSDKQHCLQECNTKEYQYITKHNKNIQDIDGDNHYFPSFVFHSAVNLEDLYTLFIGVDCTTGSFYAFDATDLVGIIKLTI